MTPPATGRSAAPTLPPDSRGNIGGVIDLIATRGRTWHRAYEVVDVPAPEPTVQDRLAAIEARLGIDAAGLRR